MKAKTMDLWALGVAIVMTAVLAAAPATAGRGDCGQVLSTGISTTAGDALFILRAAVGSFTCEYPCLCDANGSESTTAADAQLVLRRAVGQDVRLTCSCRTPQLEGLDDDAPLVLPLAVQVAYNDDTLFVHSSWQGTRGDAHRYLRYKDGQWQREGGSRREAQSTLDNDPDRGPTDVNSTIYESRVAIMLDDPAGPNAVPGFFEYGCFLTCHDHNQGMPAADVANDISKHLPAGTLGRLDLLHHRLHRGNPIGSSDDQNVDADPDGGRKRDDGERPFTSQGQDELGNPEYVIDPSTSNGLYAFHFDDVFTSPLRSLRLPETPANGAGPVAVALAYEDALIAGYVPREDDAVPLRLLQEPEGSGGDITSLATVFEPSPEDPLVGTWHSNLQRLLDTGNADDVAVADAGVYNVGFAVHTGDVTVQDHYVSFAQRLALGAAPVGEGDPPHDIVAVKVAGSGRETLPDFSDTATFPVTTLNLFQPGISSFEFVNGDNAGLVYIDPRTEQAIDQNHGGAGALTGSGLGCRNCHTAADADAYDPPTAGGFDAGSMETLAPLRGGVHSPTPLPAGS